MPSPSYFARSSSASRRPSSVNVGGIRMSITATSGGFWATELRRARWLGHGAGDGEAAVDEELDEAIAENGRVLGDGDPQRGSHQTDSGRSTVTTVGPPGGLTRLSRPSTLRTRSVRPARPLDDDPAVGRCAPPGPSSRTTRRNHVPCCAQDTDARDAWACWATFASNSATQK